LGRSGEYKEEISQDGEDEQPVKDDTVRQKILSAHKEDRWFPKRSLPGFGGESTRKIRGKKEISKNLQFNRYTSLNVEISPLKGFLSARRLRSSEKDTVRDRRKYDPEGSLGKGVLVHRVRSSSSYEGGGGYLSPSFGAQATEKKLKSLNRLDKRRSVGSDEMRARRYWG